MIARRGPTIGFNVTIYEDRTSAVNIYVDNRPYKCMKFEYEVGTLEAMQIVAVELRINGSDPFIMQ